MKIFSIQIRNITFPNKALVVCLLSRKSMEWQTAASKT